MNKTSGQKAFFHLPGLFEFYELYSRFLPLFRNHREYFYDWCEIGSIYGSPADCSWGGGRAGFGEASAREVLQLLKEYGISGRLTFSNSLLEPQHLKDKKCNDLCRQFSVTPSQDSVTPGQNSVTSSAVERSTHRLNTPVANGIILHSDLLLEYIQKNYPGFYFVSSTTKVLTDFEDFKAELERPEFKFVVPDFRLNKAFDRLNQLPQSLKDKVEFLCNECCWAGCQERKACYENVSRKNLGLDCPDHICRSPDGDKGYSFSGAMENPCFISVEDIQKVYIPAGFSNFKLEGRGLGSAVVLEFLLYYLTKPEYQLKVREEIYLDSMLDLF